MSEETVFVDGMICKKNEKAPDFVLCDLSIKCKDLVSFMRENHKDGWINVDIKMSRAGKPYASLNTWQPTQAAKPVSVEDAGGFEDDIPFAPFGKGEW